MEEVEQIEDNGNPGAPGGLGILKLHPALQAAKLRQRRRLGTVGALGNASTRFPYDHRSKPGYERDFCVLETIFGSAERGEQHVQKRRRILPEVTNLSALWGLLSQSIVRRRKEDTGEPLVKRTYYSVHVPFGRRQRELHQRWLTDFERFSQTHPA